MSPEDACQKLHWNIDNCTVEEAPNIYLHKSKEELNYIQTPRKV